MRRKVESKNVKVVGFGEVVKEVKEVEGIEKLKVDELRGLVAEYESVLCFMEIRLGRGRKIKKGRKEEVIELFLNDRKKLWSVKEISKVVGITSRNVSSQLSYLRKDGYEFVRVGGGVGKLRLDVVPGE